MAIGRSFSLPVRTHDLFILGLALGALTLRLLTNRQYGFHRDEFLYLAQGKHLDWGYWSNAPGPGFFSWLTQMTLGDSLFAIRFIPALLGVGTLILAALMAREMKGGLLAQMLAGVAVMFSSGMPRAFLMYNPVPFDIFYWTLLAYWAVKYINTSDGKFLIYFGISAALGFLNKYSIVFFVLPTLLVLACSRYRKAFGTRDFWWGTLLFILLIAPNLGWQWSYDFPVINHMRELSANQLSNVDPGGFILDQILFHFSVVLIWVPGLWYLFRDSQGTKYWPIGLIFIAIILFILLLRGKSYYTMGAFPMMFAAGAVIWEKWSRQRKYLLLIPLATTAIIFFGMAPFSVPYLPVEKMVDFGKKSSERGMEGLLRWEDGEIHHLPQDYADMLGWEELSDIVVKAVKEIPQGEPYFIYAQNFGQAGAVQYYGEKKGINNVYSFADAFAFWLPDKVDPGMKYFIYINDELGEDVEDLFAIVEKVGEVQHPFARERGTMVFFCKDPRSSLAEFWSDRVQTVRSARGIYK